MAQDFTVAEVLAWARTKPAEEGYDYTSATNCALCQFLRETGRSGDPLVGPGTYSDRDGRFRFLPDEIEGAVSAHGYKRTDDRWTFGALVERLEALVPDPVSETWTKADAYLTDIERVDA